MQTNGLRSRLIISFLTLITISLVFLGAYILWYFYQHNISGLKANLLSQGKIIEQLLQEKMANPVKKAEIDEKIKELGILLDLRITVIDATGAVLGDSENNPALMENHLTRPEVQEALSGANGASLRPSPTQGETLLYVSTPMRNGDEITGAVRMSTSLSRIDHGFTSIAIALLLALLLTAMLSIFVSVILARKYTAPLEYIIDITRQIAEGQLEKRVFIRTGNELELLAHAVNNLTSSLEDKMNDAAAKTRRLELILEHMDNAVVLLDKYGRVTTVNKKAVDIFEITPDMLGHHNIKVIGNSLLDQAVQETIALNRSKSIDLKTNFHGGKRVFQVSVAPIAGNENEIDGVLSVFHDITTLQEIHERQADFVANASHELSTPLTTIKGFAETLIDGALTDPQLSRKFVGIIHTEAERMHRLIQELLQLAKLDSQEYRRQIKIESLDLPPLLNLVKEDLTPRGGAKSQIITVEWTDEPLIIAANGDWVKQVLTNLVENSIKYTSNGGKILITANKYRDPHNRDWVKIAVKDTGIGIPASDLPLIFDRFYRVDRARARSAGGAGLGLAITKFIVEMMGGRIEVASKVDAGSTFTVILPAGPLHRSE